MDEFHRKYSGRYFGKYRAVASNVMGDPLKNGRIKLTCPVVLGVEETGWALPSPPTGGGVNTGELVLPRVGDNLWVEFEEGDPSRPIWSHGPWGNRNGYNMVPRHSVGQPDYTDYARRDYGNIPPSQFQGEYGYVRYLGSRDGSFLEMDSTPGAGRVQLSHFSGSRIEMQKDGGVQEVITQTSKKHIGEDRDIEITGKEKYFVGNGRSMEIRGDYTEAIQGSVVKSFANKQEVGQSLDQTFSGSVNTLTRGTWTSKTLSQASLQVGGQLSFSVAQNILMTASENVEIVGMNSNGALSLPPLKEAVVIQGYNGDVVVKASDPTGQALVPQLTLGGFVGSPTVGQAILEAGTIGSGKISLLPVTGAFNVHLGGAPAVEPLVLGTSYTTMQTTLMVGLQVFIAAIVGDPMLKVLAPATSAAAVTFAPLVAAYLGQLGSLLHLSTTVVTK